MLPSWMGPLSSWEVSTPLPWALTGWVGRDYLQDKAKHSILSASAPTSVKWGTIARGTQAGGPGQCHQTKEKVL